MRYLHINNSYNVWCPLTMDELLEEESLRKYGWKDYKALLNRGFLSLYIEWVLHNIGYYITKPFPKLSNITLRCKDVDLEERVDKFIP